MVAERERGGGGDTHTASLCANLDGCPALVSLNAPLLSAAGPHCYTNELFSVKFSQMDEK